MMHLVISNKTNFCRVILKLYELTRSLHKSTLSNSALEKQVIVISLIFINFHRILKQEG